MSGSGFAAAPYSVKAGVHLSGTSALVHMAPVLITAGFAILLAFLVAWNKPRARARWPWNVALIGLVLSTLWQCFALANMKTGPATKLFRGAMVVDGWSMFALLAVTVVAAVAALVRLGLDTTEHGAVGTDSTRAAQSVPLAADSSALVLISVVGMQLSVLASDLLVLLLCLEVASLPLVWLIGATRPDRGPGGQNMRAYLSDILSTGVLFWACVMLLLGSGTTNLDYLARDLHAFAASPLTAFAVVLLCAGLAWKCAAPPLDFGAPATSASAPPPAALLLDCGARTAAFVATYRVLTTALGHDHLSFGPAGWCSLVALVAGVALAVGSAAALWQRRMSDLGAHLTVAVVGWLLLGTVASGLEHPHSAQSRTAVAYLLANHIVGLSGLYALSWWIEKGRTAAPGDELRLPPVWRGLSRKRPFAAFAAIVLTCQVMGLPPTSGFFARLDLLQVFLSLESLKGLSILVVICWVVSAVPLMRILQAMYSLKPAPVAAAAAATTESGSVQTGAEPGPTPALEDADPKAADKESEIRSRDNRILAWVTGVVTITALAAGLFPEVLLRAIQRLFSS